MLLYDRNIIGASSEIFGNLRKISEKCSETFALPSEQFWKIFGKWSEIFGESSKTPSLVCLCNKQSITCPLVDMNFIFSCSTRHLTRSLRSLVRYRVEHSKIKFISTRGHVISSISLYTQNKSAKNICIEEKVIIRINFNPGLALTGFRTILPCFQQVNLT